MVLSWEALAQILAWLVPLVLWLAFWLLAVNWQKAWPVLAAGAWVPVVLLAILAALAWAHIAPSTCTVLGILSLPNFWWQLGASLLIVGTALFAGWLQGVIAYSPPEISVEPPAHVEHGHGHH